MLINLNFRNTVVITCLSVATVLLTLTSVLVMAEEFQQLPKNLQRISTKLVDNRTSRTVLICGVIILMALASSLSLIINSESSLTSILNDTRIIPSSLASLALRANRKRNESKSALDDDVVVNLSLAVTVYRNFSDGNTNSTFQLVRYNCTEDCIKSVVNATGLRNLEGTTSESLSYPKKIVDQLLKPYRNISAIGVITATYDDCPHPEYIVFTWVLCMIALATALKLYYLIKLFLAIVMVAVYAILILMGYNQVFTGDYINADE